MAVLDRFPFTIPYQIAHDGVVIVALAHTSRRPDQWTRPGIGPTCTPRFALSTTADDLPRDGVAAPTREAWSPRGI